MADILIDAHRMSASKMTAGRMPTDTPERASRSEEEDRSSFAPPATAFGEWIRSQREKRNVSVGTLVALSGLSKNYIYRVEEGKVRPSRDVAGRLSEAVGAPKEDGLLAAYYLPNSLMAFQNVEVRKLALLYESLPPTLKQHVMHVAEAATDMAARLSSDKAAQSGSAGVAEGS